MVQQPAVAGDHHVGRGDHEIPRRAVSRRGIGHAEHRRTQQRPEPGHVRQDRTDVHGCTHSRSIRCDHGFGALPAGCGRSCTQQAITRADARYLLLDLWSRSGSTVIFVSHSIPEAVTLSDRVVVMAARPGRVAAVERITLPRPRRAEVEDSAAFHEHVRRLRAGLREHHG